MGCPRIVSMLLKQKVALRYRSCISESKTIAIGLPLSPVLFIIHFAGTEKLHGNSPGWTLTNADDTLTYEKRKC